MGFFYLLLLLSFRYGFFVFFFFFGVKELKVFFFCQLQIGVYVDLMWVTQAFKRHWIMLVELGLIAIPSIKMEFVIAQIL